MNVLLKRFLNRGNLIITGVIAVICLGIGGFLGYYFRPYLRAYFVLPDAPSYVQRISLNTTQYKFIDPLLGYDTPLISSRAVYQPFIKQVQNLADTLPGAHNDKNETISVYLKDFKNDLQFGVNTDEKFHPASMFKIAIMISYFKAAETNPKILDARVSYEGGQDANQWEYIKPEEYITPGKTYSVRELLRYMIVYSDNNATNVLLTGLDSTSFNAVFKDLGITLPSNISDLSDDFITSQQMSLLLRVLRNSTYLTPDSSEAALKMLAESDFSDGVVAGVPQGTTVAHKFGEYMSRNPDGTTSYQLHDCGVVYAPRPYLLCVMTKGGNDYKNLESDIATISQFIYKEITTNYQD